MHWLLQLAVYATGGIVLFYADCFVDRRVAGSADKMRGPIPFWWILVAGLPLGWAIGMATASSPFPLWMQVTGLLVLLLVTASAFCLRFGMRPQR